MIFLRFDRNLNWLFLAMRIEATMKPTDNTQENEMKFYAKNKSETRKIRCHRKMRKKIGSFRFDDANEYRWQNLFFFSLAFGHCRILVLFVSLTFSSRSNSRKLLFLFVSVNRKIQTLAVADDIVLPCFGICFRSIKIDVTDKMKRKKRKIDQKNRTTFSLSQTQNEIV